MKKKQIKYVPGIFHQCYIVDNFEFWENFPEKMWGLGYEMDACSSFEEYRKKSKLPLKPVHSERKERRNILYLLEHAGRQIVGNANRQETAPDGSKDENVFDIKQGVSIVLLIKQSSIHKETIVKRYDIWGVREEKYEYLLSQSIETISWRNITPTPPMNAFFLQDYSLKAKYEKGFSLKDLFVVNGTGVLTKRDNLCIHFTCDEAFQAAKDISCQEETYVKQKYSIPEDVRDWKYVWAKKDIIESGITREKVIPITYRPFDNRYTYYTGNARGFMGWPVVAVMKHLIETSNIALVTARSNKAANSTHFFVSSNIVEYKCGERTTNSSVFPLYLCSDGINQEQPNFTASIIDHIQEMTNLVHNESTKDKNRFFSAIDVFAYIYAVLYSVRYREKYREFLNRDFPIIPYPKNKEYFWTMQQYGMQLIQNHLLHNLSALEDDVQFISTGGMTVEKVIFKNDRVYINRASYFSGVSENVWNFLVGGYEVLQRWFKDRKGRTLSSEEIERYIQIINAIKRTIIIMDQIDAVIEC